MNYFGVSMSLLSFEKGGNFIKGTYGYVFVLIPLLFVIVKVSGMVGYAKRLEANRIKA